jgi:hypothetical protein
MWQNFGFFGNLNEFLTERINAVISEKQKHSLQILREYAQFRAKVEENVIENLVDWRAYFETVDYLGFPSETDIKLASLLSDSDIMTFTVILNHALKGYIDNYMENSENCQILYGYYQLLKEETQRRPSLGFYPKEDGFKDYLSTRAWRHEENRKLEDARLKGNYCIFCGSENVRSYNKQEWKCYDCGKRFRKHA